MEKETGRTLISNDLAKAERALDDALVRQAELLTTMVAVRREISSGPFTGHTALLRLLQSQQAILSAEGDLARVHGNMAKIQLDVFGYEECPPGRPMVFGQDELITAQ